MYKTLAECVDCGSKNLESDLKEDVEVNPDVVIPCYYVECLDCKTEYVVYLEVSDWEYKT